MSAIPDAKGIELPRLILLLGVTAFVYLLLGALGLSFAIAPGYASPIFPAAGFAVAMLLWAGNRAWPAIWLGSFLLNLGTTWLRGDPGWMPALVAAGIAFGTAAQALAARLLVARSVGSGWQSMEQAPDIVRSLLLAGPTACVLSASVGVTTLYLAGIVRGGELLYSWWNWWSGDTLGVLVTLPLTLTFLLRADSPWRARLTTLLPPMLIALMTVSAAFAAVSHWERTQQATAIRNHGEALKQQIEQRFIAHQEALSALRRLIEVAPEMSYAQFEYFTSITLKDNPDIFALSINHLVPQAQRSAYERSMARKTGNPRFGITERDSQHKLVRAAERPEYVSVGYISPLEDNRPAVGYDINSEPIRHAAIQNARRTGMPAVTAPIRLVQENRQRAGVLVLHPAYRDRVPGVAAGDGKNPAAFVVGVIKVDQMIDIAARQIAVPGLVFQVDDADAPDDKARFYRSDEAPAALDRAYDWQMRLAIADRTWTLRVMPTERYLRQQPNWQAMLVGAGGLALAALLQVLILVATGRTSIIQHKVEEQTAELKAKSNVLEDRNAQLNALFSLSPDAFVTFAADGRVQFVNPAFQVLTGIRPDTVVGKSEKSLDDELRRRSEPAEAFAGVAAFFGEIGAPPLPPGTLILKAPRHAVLSAVGAHSESASMPRILYLHEITREAEIDRMKSEFLSHAAHELRTPMTSILGFSELLLRREVNATKRHELLDIIHRQTQRLVVIINDLLDLSRIEARGGSDLKIEPVDLRGIAAAAARSLSLDGERWRLVVDLPPGPVRVRADQAKLHQALTNMLGNAVKYSPDGGEIRVALVAAQGRAGIAVSDQGIGMTPEQLTHVGERFWRADTSGKTPGTGLGLAIVKEILKLLGGELEIRSQFGAATTVTLWLNVDQVTPEA
jgi:signal transduction histidine kinase/integral membrane sensor domain MASE1